MGHVGWGELHLASVCLAKLFKIHCYSKLYIILILFNVTICEQAQMVYLVFRPQAKPSRVLMIRYFIRLVDK